MGYKLRRGLREALGPTITGLQRAVALEIADDANESTRMSWASLEDLARWTGAKDTNVVRNALKRLAAAGWEFRVPVGKGKDGRLLYAVPGKKLTFLVPPFEGVATATPKGEHPLLQGVAPAPSQGAPAPSQGAPATPFSSVPSDSSSLSVAEQVVTAAGVVAEHERETFINWLKDKYKPNGPSWWRTVASKNGDFRELADAWRADQPATASTLPPWCGHCGDRQPLAKKDASLRLIEDDHGNRRPCPDCHPNNVRNNA
jgi:hypothetical protein